MRSAWTLLVVCSLAGLLTGCGAGYRGTSIVTSPAARPPANLVLSNTPGAVELATRFAGRTQRPAVDIGLRAEEVIYYDTFNYDYEYGFDRRHGGYLGQQSVTTGVLLR